MPGRRQIVSRELAKKLRLEKAFRREVRSLFRRIIKDFAVSVAGTGFAPSADKYKDDWKSALKKHYERVQAAFTGEVLKQQNKCNSAWWERKQNEDEENDTEKAALLALALQAWRDHHSAQSANLITRTTQKNFNDALRKARELITEQELPTDRRTLALTAAAILRDKFSGRVDGILMFETQQSAESTKLSEAEILSDIQPSVLSGLTAAIGVVKKKHGGLLGTSEFGRFIKRLMGRRSTSMNRFMLGANC
jgi:hypothetical protein